MVKYFIHYPNRYRYRDRVSANLLPRHIQIRRPDFDPGSDSDDVNYLNGGVIVIIPPPFFLTPARTLRTNEQD